MAVVVPAALPETAVHEPHAAAPERLYRYSHPVIAAFPGSVHVNTADPPAAAAESPEGFAGAGSATAATSTSPVVRFTFCACPEARTLTESFARESKSLPS